MIKPKVYHASITANTSYTFNLDVDCSTFLVKNLGEESLKVSYGSEIDNDSYVLVMPKTAETIFATMNSTPETETNQLTVLSTAAADVEVRALEY